MVAAAALGDVVQQQRDEERALGLHLADQLRRDGRDLAQLAALQRGSTPIASIVCSSTVKTW
jgi:hypothetical protein